jgi:hypothetical protein
VAHDRDVVAVVIGGPVKKDVRTCVAVASLGALIVALPFAVVAVGNWSGEKRSVAEAAAFCDAVTPGANITTVQQAAKSGQTPVWHQPDSLAFHFRFVAPGNQEAICEVGVDANGAIVSHRTRPIGLTPNVPQ